MGFLYQSVLCGAISILDVLCINFSIKAKSYDSRRIGHRFLFIKTISSVQYLTWNRLYFLLTKGATYHRKHKDKYGCILNDIQYVIQDFMLLRKVILYRNYWFEYQYTWQLKSFQNFIDLTQHFTSKHHFFVDAALFSVWMCQEFSAHISFLITEPKPFFNTDIKILISYEH